MTATRSRSGRRVDPRLQARRRTVARQDGLRRLWLVAGLTAVASLAIGAIALANSSWFDVDVVEVEGVLRVDPQQVITASSIEVGASLVDLDLVGAVTLVEAVPWVAEAAIDRSWRGVVTIHIVERVGLVALPSGPHFAVVDRTGFQLEVVAERPAGYLPVVGVEASGVPGQPVSGTGRGVVALVAQLTPAVAQVTTAIVVDDDRLMIVLTTGGRANFGDERDLDQKLIALETMLARVDLVCLDMIDVRVPSAPTVRRAGDGPATEEPLAAAGGC